MHQQSVMRKLLLICSLEVALMERVLTDFVPSVPHHDVKAPVTSAHCNVRSTRDAPHGSWRTTPSILEKLCGDHIPSHPAASFYQPYEHLSRSCSRCRIPCQRTAHVRASATRFPSSRPPGRLMTRLSPSQHVISSLDC